MPIDTVLFDADGGFQTRAVGLHASVFTITSGTEGLNLILTQFQVDVV